MDLAEGKLCHTCTAALNGETRIKAEKDYFGKVGNFPFNKYHHQSYRDLAASKEGGCFICSWLWAKLPAPPAIGKGGPTEKPAALDRFRICCRKLDDERISFHVVCPWAADVELEVGMNNKRDFPSPYAYGRPGSPPPAPWTELDTRPWSNLGTDIALGQSLPMIQGWISSCDKNHAHCCPLDSEAGTFFPTRVIDVAEADLGIVHLRNRDEVEVQHDAQGEDTPRRQGTYPAYWTLSHRWGDPKNVPQLLLATEHRFRNGIPLEHLSPTFRDAVLLVRGLRYRYIWIDSLCIFQDQELLGDWQHEAGQMMDVYRHSLCNISATAASSDPGTVGLFSKRKFDARLLFPFKVDRKLLERSGKVPDGPWVFWNDSVWTDEVESAPLSTRGWVVQERFLARRIVHFAENQIYWECMESMRCEADPTGELLVLARPGGGRSMLSTVYQKPKVMLARTREELAASGRLNYDPRNQSTGYKHHTQWGSVVSIYTNCALTNESDRLIAMSGIAKAFREVSGDTYLAGLWERMIYTDLAWTTNASGGAQVRRSESYAPTWSWASVMGGHTTLSILGGKFARLPKPLMKLVEARIELEPPGMDVTGLLRSAELDVECMLYYYRWVRNSSKFAVYTDEARTRCCFVEKMEARDLYLDTTDLVRKLVEMDETEGMCMPIYASNEGYGSVTNLYLMLEDISDGRFKRIGLFRQGGIGKGISEWSGQGTRITLV